MLGGRAAIKANLANTTLKTAAITGTDLDLGDLYFLQISKGGFI